MAAQQAASQLVTSSVTDNFDKETQKEKGYCFGDSLFLLHFCPTPFGRDDFKFVILRRAEEYALIRKNEIGAIRIKILRALPSRMTINDARACRL